MKQLVEEVFVTEGLPKLTFVKPPNFNEILLDVRHPGKPVIVEGQSGTGKTTCVRKVLEQIHGSVPEYLTARDGLDLLRIEEIARARVVGRFVIDDFHRLATETQTALANIAKFAAESGQAENTQRKLVLIGINQVGSQLIQLVPDLAKRTGIHRIQAGAGPDIELHRTAHSRRIERAEYQDSRFRVDLYRKSWRLLAHSAALSNYLHD